MVLPREKALPPGHLGCNGLRSERFKQEIYYLKTGMRSSSIVRLSFFLLVFVGVTTSSCQRFPDQGRGAVSPEGEAGHNKGGSGSQSGPAYRSYGGAGRTYSNPPMNIPRTLPPGSKIRYNSVSISQPLVAMTFDDGPHPRHTPRLLNILKQRNIKATFYVVGNLVQSHPEIVARMVREGHEVANHTWNHPDITKLSDQRTRSELQRTAQAIHKACGIYPRTFRPPYGAITERHRQWIHRDFGYPTITWNVDPKDWQRPGPSVVASRLVSGARKGSILLAHDIHSGTISAMPSALDQLLARGFRFVTVTQLINASALRVESSEQGPEISGEGLAGVENLTEPEEEVDQATEITEKTGVVESAKEQPAALETQDLGGGDAVTLNSSAPVGVASLDRNGATTDADLLAAPGLTSRN